MKTRIKAYTLTEALIAIVLSSIIVVISYALVTSISKQLNMFEKDNEEELMYNLMNATLHYDMNQAHDFYYSTNSISLYSYNNDTINYYFKKKSIVRQTRSKVDSFNIEVLDNEMKVLYNMNNLKLKLKLFNRELNTSYFVNKDLSKAINKKYFNEN